MVANRNEKRDARKIAEVLGTNYTRALRLLREGQYVVRDGQVQEVPSRGTD